MAKYQPNWFMKIKSFVTVEPILLAVGIPLYLQTISIQNMALEKSCRVNLEFSAIVCDNMMDKSMNGIHCGNITLDVIKTSSELESVNRSINNVRSSDEFYVHSSMTLLQQEVCRAEIESQKLISTISGYMAPLESILGICIILIGGYISDNSGRRKPLILYPIIGQFSTQVVYLIGATLLTELPVQFITILVPIIREITGGYSLLFMGLSCYLTEITEGKDRVFRFGLMYQLFPLMAIATLPFSGILYQKLGYIRMSFICLIFVFIAVIYVIFVFKESQVVLQTNLQNTVSTATSHFDSDLELKESETIAEHGRSIDTSNQKEDHRWFIECRDCKAVRNVVSVLMRRRNERGRTIVILLLIGNFVSVGCEHEYINEYFFVRTKLNWEALDESPFAAYSETTAFFGNILMIAVFSKYYNMPSAVIGLIASTCSTVSKLICITISTTYMLYVARTFDMFAASYGIANRSIMSMVVNNNEIGRMFSLMGVLENFSKLIFLPIYTNIYKQTVETFPNAYFIVSFVGMLCVATIFGILCCYVKSPSINPLDITTERLQTKSNVVVKLTEAE